MEEEKPKKVNSAMDSQQTSNNNTHHLWQQTSYEKGSPKKHLQEDNNAQALPSRDPTIAGQILGFHPGEHVENNAHKDTTHEKLTLSGATIEGQT